MDLMKSIDYTSSCLRSIVKSGYNTAEFHNQSYARKSENR